MTLACAILIVLVFIFLLRCLRVPGYAIEVVHRCRVAVHDLRDVDLGDEEKERAIQGHALGLLKLFVLLTATAALALAVPIGLVYLLDLADLVELGAVLDSTITWQFLLGTAVACLVLAVLYRRRRRVVA